MSIEAVKVIERNLETLDPCLDLSRLGLWDRSFSWLSKLDRLLAQCTHIKTLVLSNREENSTSFLKGQLRPITIDTGINCLSIPPAAIKKLINLNELYMSGLCSTKWGINDLSFLSTLQGLKKIDLGYNDIKDIKGLDKLSELTHLILSNNKIIDIKGLGSLKNLQQLVLSHNQITEIKGLDELASLQYLHLNNNRITGIKGVENLRQLHYLNLSRNHITEIENLEELHGLQQLYLERNGIQEIKGLDNLLALQHLDIQSNQIDDISPLWTYIKNAGSSMRVSTKKSYTDSKLDTILVEGNPLLSPPMEVIERGHEAVLEYIDAASRIGLQPLNECKVIIVGDGGVGKTSLLKRIVSGDFNPSEPTTHGINKIAWRGIKDEIGDTITVNVWDFGGQHLQHSLHQFFFSKRVVYILVINPRTMGKAGYWMGQIEKLGGNSEVMVVYNFQDQKDSEASFATDYYELCKKYKQLGQHFHEISCLEGTNIDVFREALTTVILNKVDLKTPYPTNWYHIKREIEEKVKLRKDNFYVHYDEYVKICIANKYPDPDRQKGLLVQLDDIGSIVFFDRDDVNHLQVLNPEWITTGAYSILTSVITKKKNGYLTMNDLREIFKEEKTIFSDNSIKIKYEEHHFKYIIDLMQHYNLCERNPFDRNQVSYLVPAALTGLPKIDISDHKRTGKQYRFEFDVAFEMIIMHRFIARNLHKSKESEFWQSGIVIQDEQSDASALVETDQHSKLINFWIKGRDARGFWESLRRDMHHICKIYQNLRIEETVFYQKGEVQGFLSYQLMWNYLHTDGDMEQTTMPVSDYGVAKVNILKELENFRSKNFIMETLEKIRAELKNELAKSNSLLDNIDRKLSGQNKLILDLINLGYESKNTLISVLDKIDNSYSLEMAQKKILEMDAAFSEKLDQLPSVIQVQWAALNNKASDGIDVKAKLKFKVPIIPFLLEYEGELSVDAKKLARKLNGILI